MLRSMPAACSRWRSLATVQRGMTAMLAVISEAVSSGTTTQRTRDTSQPMPAAVISMLVAAMCVNRLLLQRCVVDARQLHLWLCS